MVHALFNPDAHGKPTGILDGDYVVATQVTHPNNGDVVVALDNLLLACFDE